VSWVLDLEQRGASQAAARINRLADNAADSRGFFDKVAKILLRQSQDRWRRNGYGWTPLDPDTIRQKAKRKQSGGILRATGALQKALTVWRAPGQKVVFASDHFIFGLKIGGESEREAFYGHFHQTGKGVPKRVVLKATQATRRNVRKALLDHLMEGG
jgi:phage gpG-like protein